MAAQQYAYLIERLREIWQSTLERAPHLGNQLEELSREVDELDLNDERQMKQWFISQSNRLRAQADLLFVTGSRTFVAKQNELKERRNLVRKLELIDEMKRTYLRAIEQLPTLAANIQQQRKVLFSELNQQIAILSPNVLESDFSFHEVGEARRAARAAFNHWYEPIPELCMNYVQSCYEPLKQTKLQAQADEVQGLVMQWVDELNRSITRLTTQIYGCELAPLSPQWEEEVGGWTYPGQAVFSMEQFDFRKHIHLIERKKNHILFLAKYVYAYHLTDVIHHARLQVTSSIALYDEQVRAAIADHYYSEYPAQLLQSVRTVIEQQLEVLKQFELDVKANHRDDDEQTEEDAQLAATPYYESSAFIEFISLYTNASDEQTVYLNAKDSLDEALSRVQSNTTIRLTPGTYTIRKAHLLDHHVHLQSVSPGSVKLEFSEFGSIKTQSWSCFVLEQVSVEVKAIGHSFIHGAGVTVMLLDTNWLGTDQAVAVYVDRDTSLFVNNCQFETFATSLESISQHSIIVRNSMFRNQHAALMITDSQLHLHGCKFLHNESSLTLHRVDCKSEHNEWGVNSNCALIAKHQSIVELARDKFYASEIAVYMDEQSSLFAKDSHFSQHLTTAILAQQAEEVIVDNCTFYDDEIAFVATTGSNIVLQHNKLSSCTKGALFVGTSKGVFRSNTVSQSKQSSIQCDNKAKVRIEANIFSDQKGSLVVGGESELHILHNQFVNHYEQAIAARGQAEVTITENTFTSNTIDVLGQEQSFVAIERNDSSKAITVALRIQDTCQASVSGNTFKDSLAALQVLNEADVRIVDNQFMQLSVALHLGGGTYSLTRNNRFTNSNVSAIRIAEHAHAIVEENDIRFSNIGIVTEGESRFLLKRNTVTFNEEIGIRVGGFSEGIVDSNVLNNSDNGIYLTDHSSVETVNNECIANKIGINIERMVKCDVRRNRCTHNDTGIVVNGMRKIRIVDNTSETNKVGIAVVYFAAPIIFNNIIQSNMEAGVIYRGDAAGELNGNLIRANRTGVQIGGRAAPTLQLNEVAGNAEGLILDEDSKIQFIDNRVHNNERVALDVKGRSRLIGQRNEFRGNLQTTIKIAEEANLTMDTMMIEQSSLGILMQDDSSLECNASTFNTRSGEAIQLGGQATCVVKESAFITNHVGIRAKSKSNIWIQACTLQSNKAAAIIMMNRSKIDAIYNEIIDNEQDAVQLTEYATFLLRDNKIARNGLNGIHIKGHASGKLRNNKLELNGELPVKVEPTSAVIFEKQRVFGIVTYLLFRQWNHRRNIRMSKQNMASALRGNSKTGKGSEHQ